MNIIFIITNVTFDLLFSPFRNLNPAWGMLWISLLTGILMLIIFRFTSNQRGIKNAKAKVGAYILEMRLYNHNLEKMISSLWKTFLANLFYLRYMIVPLIFIIIPVLTVLIQISYRYEHRSLQPDEQTIIKAVLKPGTPVFDNPVSLQVPDKIDIRIPPLRIASSNEIIWRISGREKGVYELDFVVNEKNYKKNLHIGTDLTPLSSERSSFLFDSLINHSESLLPDDSPFISLQIKYPEKTLEIIGFEFHWIIWFFIFSVVAGFAFKNMFKVEL